MNMRLDKFISLQLKDHSRSFLQKLIADNLVTVNEKQEKASYRLAANDRVLVEIPPPDGDPAGGYSIRDRL